MRATFGLAVPLLLLVASFSTLVPQAAAEVTYYSVSGVVKSDAGVPLEGVRVSAYSYPEERMYADDGAIRNADAITGADGAYALKLPAGKGWISVYYEKWRQNDGKEIVVEGDTTIDFTLRTPPPKDAIIEGRVVDVNGNPVADAEVSLQTRCCYAMPVAEASPTTTEPAPPSDGNSTASSGVAVDPSRSYMPYYWEDYATTRTDADGRFRFEAYEGQREIYAWAKGFAQSNVPVETISGKTVTVEVVLEKVPASDAVVTGRVIDANTGLPLARAQVNLRSLEWGRYAWAETDKDGSFRLTTVPGWAEISVNFYQYYDEPIPLDASSDVVASKPMIMPAPQGPQYYPYMALIDLESGENRIDAPLDPKPRPTVALIGYVVDPDTKKAVPDARVSVWNHETGDWGEAITDATGSYKIMVREGHYSGSAYKDGYLGGTQSFRVTDTTTQRVDLLMPKGTTKWAPCYEDDPGCGGPIMYGRAEAVYAGDGSTGSAGTTDYEEAKAQSSGAPAPAPAVAPTMGGLASADSSSSASAGERSGPATYSGEGGGLPPYDPDATQTIPASERANDSMVPGAGVLAIVVALAGAAMIAARRRR